MLRLLIFFAVITAAAFGLAWLADNPGVVTFTWRGVEYETSMMLAVGVILALAVVLAIVWMACAPHPPPGRKTPRVSSASAPPPKRSSTLR